MPSRTLMLSSLAAVAALVDPAFAQLGPEAFPPRSTLGRFLPEQLPALDYPAYYGELERAQALVHGGRYKAAIYASQTLPADTPPVEASLVRSAALWAIGEHDAARAALDGVASDADPRVPVLLARIDLSAGKYAEAIARLKPIVEASPDLVPPRVYLADAHAAAGDFRSAAALDARFAEGADATLARFRSEGALGFESAEDLTLAARAIDRWASFTGAYGKDRRLYDDVLGMLVAAYDTVDREYWPARVAAADYLFAHGNREAAAGELEMANAMNPNAVEVNATLGKFAAAAREEAGMRAAIAGLRDVDPGSFDALLVETQLHLHRRAYDAALAAARAAADRQPGNLAALGLLAGAYAAQANAEALAETFARVDAVAPVDATARYRVALVYNDLFSDPAAAATLLREAVSRAPWWTPARHELGVALIQDGQEDEALAVLDAAQSVDPFNVLTVNYLRVLDRLKTFKVFEGERFTFKYDRVDDPIVPLYLAPQMDAMYDDLVKRYAFSPPDKPIVEVFPDGPSFSARTSGMPGLEGAYGASLGRVMTVVAPRAGETLGPFNWARVMRHEFTHTLNLMQTRGRVPRWLTEGLAVYEEGVPYRFAYVPPQIYELAMKGKLPKPGEMGQSINEMGYMSGFWVARFIVDEHGGWASILKLLDGYRDGLEDDGAFRQATGLGLAEFNQAYDAWAKEQVKDWGYDEATKKKVEAMTKEAEGLTTANQHDKAVAAWNAIAKLQPMNPLPPRRLAGLFLRAEQPAEALPFLIQTLPLELSDSRFAKRVASIYDQANDPANAMKYATVALGIDPYDPGVHELLAGFHAKAGDTAKAAQETQVAALLRERRERTAPSQ